MSLFVCFSIFTILMALAVVFSRSAIYSAFSLILCFFGLAGLYLLLGTPFLAMIQILIYTGAIVVLFVFVVMIINLNQEDKRLPQNRFVLLLALAAVGAIVFLLLQHLNLSPQIIASPLHKELSLRGASKMLFVEYLWPFEVLSVFLLAMTVAVFAISAGEK